MLKILQARLQQYMNMNFQMFKLVLEKAEQPEIKLPTSAATATAKSLQSCPTLCDPIDGSPPGSTVPGIPRQEHWSGWPFPSPMHESEK